MFCGKCGHKFANTDVAFCTRCGTKIPTVEAIGASEQKAAKSKQINKRTLMACVVASVAVISVLMLALMFFGDSDEEDNVSTPSIEHNREIASTPNVEIYEGEAEGQNIESHTGAVQVLGFEIVAPPIYSEVLRFTDGVIPVLAEGGWGLIDATGNEIVSPRYDNPTYRRPLYSHGLRAVRLNGRWGFVDAFGNEVIPPIYGGTSNFSDGLALVNVGDWQTSLVGLIDTSGNIVIHPMYNSIGRFSEGLAAMRVGDRWGFIDSAGNEVIPPTFCGLENWWIHGFSEGLAAVAVGDVWSFVNTDGDIFPIDLDIHIIDIRGIIDGLAAVRVAPSERWGYYTSDILDNIRFANFHKCLQ